MLMEWNETLGYVIVAGLTLFCKWLWDRYLSQGSRVTAKEFKDKMAEVEKQLAEGEKTFKQIGSCITAACLIMLKLCKNANIDCKEIEQQMIDAGMNL